MSENIKPIKTKNPFNKFKTVSTAKDPLKFKTFVSTQLNPSIDNNILYEKKKNIKFLSKKNPCFKIYNISERTKNNSLLNSKYNNGRWSEEERNKFFQGIALYGINWKKIKSLIPTRSTIQVRSHAQKFFHKMKLCKDLNLGLDFTLNSISNIKDMVNQIKSSNSDYNIAEIFKHLSNKIENRRKFKKINKNCKKNNNKNELNDLYLKDKNNNLNQNNHFMINNIEQINEKIKMNDQINNYFNINYLQNNYSLFNNLNFTNNINNDYNNLQNILNNIILLNAFNNLSSNNYFNLNNQLNNNLLSDYLSKYNLNISFINYLSQINNLLSSLRAQNFNLNNSNIINNQYDRFNQFNFPINNQDINKGNYLTVNNLLLNINQEKEIIFNDYMKNIENKRDI